MKLLSKVLLALALAVAGTGIIASCNEKPVTPPGNNPEKPQPEKPKSDNPNPDKPKPEEPKPNPDPQPQPNPDPQPQPNPDPQPQPNPDPQPQPNPDPQPQPNPDPQPQPNPDPQPQPNPDPQPQPNPDPQPQPNPEPNKLKEVKVVFDGTNKTFGSDNIEFSFEGIDQLPTLKNEYKDLVKEYYKSQLIINGVENPNLEYFGIKIQGNKLTLFNIGETFNNEVVLKSGTILKVVNAEGQLEELAVTTNEIRLRYDGEKYVESAQPLEKKATEFTVDNENLQLTHENKEGVDFNVTLQPEESTGQVTAELKEADPKVTVTVDSLKVNVKTTKKPTEETQVVVVIKLVDTEFSKEVTVTIPKYERVVQDVEVTNVSEQDQHSPLVLSFGDLVLSQDGSKQNIEDEQVLAAIKAKITGKELDYVKYEDNKLKVYFNNETNKLENGQIIEVAQDLPLYQFIDGEYEQVGKTTNSLKLIAIDGKFKNWQTGEKTLTLVYKVKEDKANERIVYNGENVSITEVRPFYTGQYPTVTYKYNVEHPSTMTIKRVDDLNAHMANSENGVTKLHDFKLSLYNTQKNEDNITIYIEEGIEEYLNVEATDGNTVVVFASNTLGENELPRLYYWGFEGKLEWNDKPQMQKVDGKKVYTFVIKATKQAEELGFIITNANGTKLTGDIKSTNETIKAHFESEDKVKVLYVYSDVVKGEENNLDGITLGTSMNFAEFLEKVKAMN